MKTRLGFLPYTGRPKTVTMNLGCLTPAVFGTAQSHLLFQNKPDVVTLATNMRYGITYKMATCFENAE